MAALRTLARFMTVTATMTERIIDLVVPLAHEATERRIEDTVYTRMLDPDYVIDALSVLITDSQIAQWTLADLVMGYGDMDVNVGNLRCDVRAYLLDWVRKDAERGKI